MNELMIFEGHEVEVFELNGNVLFNPYHVGVCLELSESAVRNYLAKMNEKQAFILKNSDVRDKDIRKLNNAGEKFLTESGVYKLVFRSRKPNAERFTDWVTDDVLPSIRKNGGYIAGQENDTPEMIIAKALVVAQNVIKENEKKIAELQPKANYFDDLVERNLLTNFRDTAKELHTKQKSFVEWLISKRYIYRDDKGKLKPYQPYVEKGYFELKEFIRGNFSDVQTLITPRGREAFRLLYER